MDNAEVVLDCFNSDLISMEELRYDDNFYENSRIGRVLVLRSARCMTVRSNIEQFPNNDYDEEFSFRGWSGMLSLLSAIETPVYPLQNCAAIHPEASDHLNLRGTIIKSTSRPFHLASSPSPHHLDPFHFWIIFSLVYRVIRASSSILVSSNCS